MRIEPTMSGQASNMIGATAALYGESWYVVQARPHQENRAVEHVEQQGFRAFCPRLKKTVRHARKTRITFAPLFPGYFFVPLDLTRDRWRTFNGTRGVVRIVTNGDQPSPVPCGVIESLILRTNSDGTIDWLPSLDVGASVVIADGPFADLVGTLEHLGPDGRVRVLLSILGRPVNVSLHQQSLMPAA
jgi:transcription elongation factor/antiterminator RfaH